MKEIQQKKILQTAFFSGILAIELAVLLDVILVFNGTALSVVKFGALLAVLFLVLFFLPGLQLKHRKLLSGAIAAVVGIPLLVCVLCWQSVSSSSVYHSADDGKAKLYAGQKVMLLVPHQDDDVNVLGGVMEEYVRYGSELYVVFSTNGDYYGLAETRVREALDVLGSIGIPEDHVIFLGYGDQWDPEGPHIYNAAPGEVVRSHIGYTQTYGAAGYEAYQSGKDYTIDNFLADIESLILEYRPDVLYCVDYDYNIDHRALSLSFEKVMGRILKEHPDYRPQVFKGYAYNTAWEAEADFYGENLLSAQNIFEEPYLQQPGVYRWENRVRLPVSADGLSRSVLSAKQNMMLSGYASQGAWLYGRRVINSDKVFWQRDTDSLLYSAVLETSSGSGTLLNDFMLLESRDLLGQGDLPYDGVWIPEESDAEKEVVIAFRQPRDIARIVLYDHPDPDKNVLNAKIAFDDGTVVETGPLDPGGAATRIPVEKEKVSSFTVTLLDVQGEAGLTELEAFSSERPVGPEYVKIMDEAGSFVYDYWIEPDGEQAFYVYNPGNVALKDTVSCSNQRCSARWQDGAVLVNCPEGESCIFYVADESGQYQDAVYIQNPGRAERAWKLFWLRGEETVLKLCESKRLHERIFVCRLYTKLTGLLK